MINNKYILNGWLVDVSLGEISRGGETRHLEPQVMKVLSYLADRPNKLVTRDEIFGSLWGHSFVSDAALTRCVFEIRRAFGDDPRNPSLVETIPRKGFRLVATPTAQPEPVQSGRRLSYWATAATVILLFSLSQIGASSNSENAHSENASLAYEAYTNALLHRDTWSRISLENAIALYEKAIQLDPSFGPAYAGLASTLSQQQMFWGIDRFDEAQAAAQMAVQLSPDDSRAHSALGLVRQICGDIPAALDAFELARSLDPDNAVPIYHAANLYRYQSKFKRAADLYQEVIRLEPDNAAAKGLLGFVHLRMGNVNVASQWIDQAIEDVPYEAYANLQLATMEMVRGNPGNAIEICEKMYELYPRSRGCLHVLGTSNLTLGNHREAMRWFSTLKNNFTGKNYALLGEAQVLIANGQHEQGMVLVNDVQQRAIAAANLPGADWNDFWMIAACFALKGDTDNAFVWLDKATSAGRRFYLWDARETVFSTLRGDQRFDQYLAATKHLSNQAN